MDTPLTSSNSTYLCSKVAPKNTKSYNIERTCVQDFSASANALFTRMHTGISNAQRSFERAIVGKVTVNKNSHINTSCNHASTITRLLLQPLRIHALLTEAHHCQMQHFPQMPPLRPKLCKLGSLSHSAGMLLAVSCTSCRYDVDGAHAVSH